MPKKIYSLLERHYRSKIPWIEVREELKKAGISKRKDGRLTDPFENLVMGILSQNTSDGNSAKAYIGLARRFKRISPEVMAKAKPSEIEKVIRPGGIYKNKARRINALAKIILEKFRGNLKEIIIMSEKKARKELLALPGIGQKTADIFMGYCMNKDIIPIDTHIARVAKRTGIAKSSLKYEEIQKSLSKVLPKGKRLRGHEYLIRLGRDFCFAKNPLCEKCPIGSVCRQLDYKL